PIHIVERPCPRHLDAGCGRVIPHPAMAMGAEIHADDIAAVGDAIVMHGLAGHLEVGIAHDHRNRPGGARVALTVLTVAIVDAERGRREPIAHRAALATAFYWKIHLLLLKWSVRCRTVAVRFEAGADHNRNWSGRHLLPKSTGHRRSKR